VARNSPSDIKREKEGGGVQGKSVPPVAAEHVRKEKKKRGRIWPSDLPKESKRAHVPDGEKKGKRVVVPRLAIQRERKKKKGETGGVPFISGRGKDCGAHQPLICFAGEGKREKKIQDQPSRSRRIGGGEGP